jgi:hypothetical protein
MMGMQSLHPTAAALVLCSKLAGVAGERGRSAMEEMHDIRPAASPV